MSNRTISLVTYATKWRVVKDIKGIRQGEIGSDHYLLKMELKARNGNKRDKWRMRVKEKIMSHKLRELPCRIKYQEMLQKKLKDFNESAWMENKWV